MKEKTQTTTTTKMKKKKEAMHYYKKGDGREAGAAEGETLDSMNVRPTQVRPE